MVGERGFEEVGIAVVAGYEGRRAQRARNGPGLALCLGGGAEGRGHAPRLVESSEPGVGVDELGGRAEVDVGDARLGEQSLLMLEVARGLGGATEAELELAEGRGDPDLVESRPELSTEGERPRSRRCGTPTRALAERAAMRARPARTPSSVCWALSRASSIASRYEVSAIAQRSVVAWSRAIRFSTKGSAPTAARARAPASASSRSPRPASASRRKIGACASHGKSWRSSRSSGVLLRKRDSLAERVGTGRGVAAEDLRHPERSGREEVAAGRGVLGQRRLGALRGRQHRRRLAGVEARGGGLGEHRDRASGSARCAGRGEDRVGRHHRAATCGDVPGELVDLYESAPRSSR